MKATMLRVPKVIAPEPPPDAFTALRQRVFEQSPSAIEIGEAVEVLETRERKLIGAATVRKYPPEPVEPSAFRVPTARTEGVRRAHAKPKKDGAQAVKGGRTAVAEGEHDP
jgi:hypothetical protein